MYRILSIFLPVIRGMHFLLTQVWDANGRYFWVKLLIIEVVEIIVQFTSLASSAVDSDADEVVLSAQVLALTCIVLPLNVLLSPRFCKLSHYTRLATVIVLEVSFDKLLVSVAVFVRFKTIIQPGLKLQDQLARHLGLLVPALMTFLDVNDALLLSDSERAQKGPQKLRNKPGHEIESLGRRQAGTNTLQESERTLCML